MTDYAYYPGCSLHGTEREYDISLRAIAKILGHNLEEIPDWICCGATSAHTIDRNLALALATDTLIKAHSSGYNKILAPCAMCYSRLATLHHRLASPQSRPLATEKAFGISSQELATVQPYSLLDWLHNISDKELLAPLKRPLAGIKIACYYGCLLVRPQNITGTNDSEFPREMERVLQLIGAETILWPMSTACCGASFSLPDKKLVFRLGKKIVNSARQAGAQLIAVACPMCHTNLDMRQTEYQSCSQRIPALYITQIIGYAYGLSPSELGLRRNFIESPLTSN